MAVPVHLFLKDDGGAMIRGGSDVADREGSIELRDLIHNLSIPQMMQRVNSQVQGNTLLSVSQKQLIHLHPIYTKLWLQVKRFIVLN